METPKAYTKPTLSRVELRPEETVLSGCKGIEDCFDLEHPGSYSTALGS